MPLPDPLSSLVRPGDTNYAIGDTEPGPICFCHSHSNSNSTDLGQWSSLPFPVTFKLCAETRSGYFSGLFRRRNSEKPIWDKTAVKSDNKWHPCQWSSLNSICTMRRRRHPTGHLSAELSQSVNHAKKRWMGRERAPWIYGISNKDLSN